MISALYFPDFLPAINDIEQASRQYAVWITQTGQRRLAGESVYTGFNEAYQPYWAKVVSVSEPNYKVRCGSTRANLRAKHARLIVPYGDV